MLGGRDAAGWTGRTATAPAAARARLANDEVLGTRRDAPDSGNTGVVADQIARVFRVDAGVHGGDNAFLVLLELAGLYFVPIRILLRYSFLDGGHIRHCCAAAAGDHRRIHESTTYGLVYFGLGRLIARD